MSNPYSAPWSVSERMELLTNMLQAAVPDPSSFLFQVLVEHNIQPKWDDMALPRGTSTETVPASGRPLGARASSTDRFEQDFPEFDLFPARNPSAAGPWRAAAQDPESQAFC